MTSTFCCMWRLLHHILTVGNDCEGTMGTSVAIKGDFNTPIATQPMADECVNRSSTRQRLDVDALGIRNG